MSLVCELEKLEDSKLDPHLVVEHLKKIVQ
jgi:hypothetical protein